MRKQIRERAESILRGSPPPEEGAKPPTLQAVIEDLRIHQIELQLQNEELSNAQTELRRAVDNYTRLFDFAPVGYLTMDTSSKIIEVNLTACSMLKTSRMALTGSPFLAHVASEFHDSFWNHLRQVFIHGSAPPLDIQIKRADGARAWMRMESVRNDNAPNGPSTRTVLSDISENIRLLDELNAVKEEAQAANRAKSTFLANMAHELKTPLHAIAGAANILATTSLDTRQRELHSIIDSGVHMLSKLIDDILTFTRLESGSVESSWSEFSIHSLFDDCRRIFSAELAAKGVPILFNASPDIPPILLGDGFHLRQCLIQVVSNAVKFTSSGQIAVSAEWGKAMDNADEIRIRVSDTGCGIPKDAMPAIFQPFNQVDGTLTRKNDGVGLGLTICRKLVSLWHGDFRIESEPGRGTTCHFSMPCRSVHS